MFLEGFKLRGLPFLAFSEFADSCLELSCHTSATLLLIICIFDKWWPWQNRNNLTDWLNLISPRDRISDCPSISSKQVVDGRSAVLWPGFLLHSSLAIGCFVLLHNESSVRIVLSGPCINLGTSILWGISCAKCPIWRVHCTVRDWKTCEPL